MASCQCQGIEDLFSEKTVSRELRDYRRKGPSQTTRMLVEALKREDVQGLSLLDIGGGVGAIQHELLGAGVDHATDIDASQSYLRAAQEEAERRRLDGRIRFIHGNFVETAGLIPPADIVTLDRVICCYDDMPPLVDLSAARARRFYGLVYPRDTWLAKLGLRMLNTFFKLQRCKYRSFVHPTRNVEALVARQGLSRRFYGRTLFWQVAVYGR